MKGVMARQFFPPSQIQALLFWTAIEANGPGDMPSFIPETTGAYRLKVTERDCNPIFSDSLKVFSRNTSVSEFLAEAIPFSDLLSAGISVPDLLATGLTVNELVEAGVAISDLPAAGVTVPGFSCDTNVGFGKDWQMNASTYPVK